MWTIDRILWTTDRNRSSDKTMPNKNKPAIPEGLSESISDEKIVVAKGKKTKGAVLRHTNNHTVQPVALMRLGLFVPTLKSFPRARRVTRTKIDATQELVQLKISQAEGYQNVSITGNRLDMDSDFKTWVGLVRSLAEHGDSSGKVEMSITELARMCGFPGAELRSRLRKRITDSLERIMSVVIHLKMQTGLDGDADESDGLMLHLIKDVRYSDKKNYVTFSADPRLEELYKVDHNVLLHLKVIRTLPKKESAQALYTFIESLPKKPVPISMKRLRDRLNLTSAVNEQNRTIRRALATLKEIGYLEYSELTKGREIYFQIHKRNPKLLQKIVDAPEADNPDQQAAVPALNNKQKLLYDALASLNDGDIEKMLASLAVKKSP